MLSPGAYGDCCETLGAGLGVLNIVGLGLSVQPSVSVFLCLSVCLSVRLSALSLCV